MAIVLNRPHCADLLSPIRDVGDDLCKNILELPKDILEKIEIFLGKKKYMFQYAVLSSNRCEQSRNLVDWAEKDTLMRGPVKLTHNIYNSITYVRMFDEILWGCTEIPSNKKFNEQFISLICDPNFSKAQIIENKFDIINEIIKYLETSPNKSITDIIWKGETIGTKKRYSEYFIENTFWDNRLQEIKQKNFKICGCTPFCWRCKKECSIFNVKQGDKLVVKSHENKRHYICQVKIAKYNNKYYKSIRDIYINCFSDKKGWEKIWETELCPKVEIFVELLPLPHQPPLKKTSQFVGGREKFYYMADCYTALLSWGRLNKTRYEKPRRFIIDKVYRLPWTWIKVAKKKANTALALIY